MGAVCLSGQNTSLRHQEDYKVNSKVGIEDFQIERVIGKGAFGKVFLVSKKGTSSVFAMKSMKKEVTQQRNQKSYIKTERQILEQVDSPFIVELRYAFQTPDKLFLVMDFINGGELFFHLRSSGRFTEEVSKFYSAEILLALEYLHSHDIIYRDLKPENVLIDYQGHIKITDFGMSKQFINQKKKQAFSFCGTPEYIAPEILKGEGHNQAVDFWSLGALLYQMLTGSPPFYSRNKDQMFRKMLNDPPDMKPYFSSEASDLLRRLLKVQPSQRISFANEAKGHAFFQGIDWRKLSAKEIQPPFTPSVNGPGDLRYFDKMFTEESTQQSIANSMPSFVCKYDGFTYANPADFA